MRALHPCAALNDFCEHVWSSARTRGKGNSCNSCMTVASAARQRLPRCACPGCCGRNGSVAAQRNAPLFLFHALGPARLYACLAFLIMWDHIKPCLALLPDALQHCLRPFPNRATRLARVTRARLFPRPCQKLFSKRSAVSLTLSGGGSLHWELPGGDLLHRLLVQLFLALHPLRRPAISGDRAPSSLRREATQPQTRADVRDYPQSAVSLRGKFCDGLRSDAAQESRGCGRLYENPQRVVFVPAAPSVRAGVPSQAQG